MLEIIIFISITLGIVGIFIANLITYKSDEKVITEYFNRRGENVLRIKDSSKKFFKNKDKLKEIQNNNWIKNSIIINSSVHLLRNNFYSITTSKNENIELFITNSIFFFITPKMYLDK